MIALASPEALVQRVVHLCAQLSTTGREGPLVDALVDDHRGEAVQRVGDSLVVGEPDDRPLVLLVGHLDVVPPSDADVEARVEPRPDGPVVIGRGSSDMKGGIAVAEALFGDRAIRDRSPYSLALVLYAGEEGPADANELGSVLAALPWLTRAELAVVLEPTDLQIQAGCLGGLHAELEFTGRATHSARPWNGDNALTKAGDLLAELHRRAPTEVEVDGIVFHDVLTATQASTDNARNVIPDRFVVNVNYRFAPDRDVPRAVEELRAWVGDRASVRVVDRAPPAPPQLGAPLVARFVETVGAPVAAKQAWTDVARLSAVGVPAVNYGPGATDQAHRVGESVRVAHLIAARDALARFLAGGI